MMSHQRETVNCKALEEGAVYEVYINSSCGAPAAPGDRAVYPPVFVIHRKRKGPDGCAGSHRGPSDREKLALPEEGAPCRTRDGVTLDSRFLADYHGGVARGLREGRGLLGRWMS